MIPLLSDDQNFFCGRATRSQSCSCPERRLQGLALARSGAIERANAILEALRKQGQTDEETLGMLGRTYKDLAANAVSIAARKKCLKRAMEIYREAYQTTGGYWTGINAA